MAEEKQLRAIQKMIKAGMYDEARAALMSIDHPTADKWLKKLNQISPPRTPQRRKRQPEKQRDERKSKPKVDDFYEVDNEDDFEAAGTSSASVVVIVAVLIGIGVLLVGGAFMLTQGGFVEPPITTDNTGCGAQTWVNEIDGSFNELYRYNLWDMIYIEGAQGFVDEEIRQQQIAELESRLARIENSEPPDCVADEKELLIEAYKAQIRATEILDIQNPLQAFGLFGRALDRMKEAGSNLLDLGAQFRRVDSAAINQFVNPECPAFEYVTRTMYVDNQFIVMMLTDPQITTIEQLQSYIRDLAQQYYRVLDDPNVPPCLWEVRNQFVEMIDSAQSAFEAVTGFDAYGFEVHLERFVTAVDQFYIEIEKVGLDPTQFGGLVVIRE